MDRSNFDQTMGEVALRKDVQTALWKSAVEEARTHGSPEAAKKLSLIAHHDTRSHPIWVFIADQSALITCNAVAQLRAEILQQLEGNTDG